MSIETEEDQDIEFDSLEIMGDDDYFDQPVDLQNDPDYLEKHVVYLPDRPEKRDTRGEFLNEFSWSKSRAETFQTCLRKYYWHYYASWGGWEYGADHHTRELYVMKNLSSILKTEVTAYGTIADGQPMSPAQRDSKY